MIDLGILAGLLDHGSQLVSFGPRCVNPRHERAGD
jgi:hypothetical protein